jgi:CHAD domain-containing protein
MSGARRSIPSLASFSHRQVRRAGRGIRHFGARRLHKLRIRVKKLRYAAEFLAVLWPDPATESYLPTLRGAQDEFGSFHDATRNMALLRELSPEVRKSSKSCLRRMVKRLENSGASSRRKLVRRWRDLRRPTGFEKRAKLDRQRPRLKNTERQRPPAAAVLPE